MAFLLIGCSNSGVTSDDGGVDLAASADGGGADAALVSAAFSYHPHWDGVTAVAVIGGFGTSTDWTQPLVALTNDGAGNVSAIMCGNGDGRLRAPRALSGNVPQPIGKGDFNRDGKLDFVSLSSGTVSVYLNSK